MRKILRRLLDKTDRTRGIYRLKAGGNKQEFACYSLGHATAALYFDARLTVTHFGDHCDK
jgi:hypothetical protein